MCRQARIEGILDVSLYSLEGPYKVSFSEGAELRSVRVWSNRPRLYHVVDYPIVDGWIRCEAAGLLPEFF
jgi:hypothetical protein